jgi:hypothetical protein
MVNRDPGIHLSIGEIIFDHLLELLYRSMLSAA